MIPDTFTGENWSGIDSALQLIFTGLFGAFWIAEKYELQVDESLVRCVSEES